MTTQEASDILIRMRDVKEPYPDGDQIDEAITTLVEYINVLENNGLITISNIKYYDNTRSS